MQNGQNSEKTSSIHTATNFLDPMFEQIRLKAFKFVYEYWRLIKFIESKGLLAEWQAINKSDVEEPKPDQP